MPILRFTCSLLHRALDATLTGLLVAALFYVIFVLAWGRAVNATATTPTPTPPPPAPVGPNEICDREPRAIELPAGPGGIDQPGLWPN